VGRLQRREPGLIVGRATPGPTRARSDAVVQVPWKKFAVGITSAIGKLRSIGHLRSRPALPSYVIRTRAGLAIRLRGRERETKLLSSY
jgi:hypothetical protein